MAGQRWDAMAVREYQDEQGKTRTAWTKVGAAFTGKDGMITVLLDAVPKDFKVVLQVPLTREELAAKRAGQQQQWNPQQRSQGQPQRYQQQSPRQHQQQPPRQQQPSQAQRYTQQQPGPMPQGNMFQPPQYEPEQPDPSMEFPPPDDQGGPFGP